MILRGVLILMKIYNKKLAQYLHKRITEDRLLNYRNTLEPSKTYWCQMPTVDELEFCVITFPLPL